MLRIDDEGRMWVYFIEESCQGPGGVELKLTLDVYLRLVHETSNIAALRAAILTEAERTELDTRRKNRAAKHLRMGEK